MPLERILSRSLVEDLDDLVEEPVAEDVVPPQAGAVGHPDAKSGRAWIKLCQPKEGRPTTLATARKRIHPITHDDYESIKQTAQQARPGENLEEATLRTAIGIAAIGLMRDAMLQGDESTTALWSDLEQPSAGSGRIFLRPSKTYHTDKSDIAYVSKTTMDALPAMATAQQELVARASQAGTILPADSETLLKHISDACSSAGLNGTYVADSPRAGITLDLLQSDFTN